MDLGSSIRRRRSSSSRRRKGEGAPRSGGEAAGSGGGASRFGEGAARLWKRLKGGGAARFWKRAGGDGGSPPPGKRQEGPRRDWKADARNGLKAFGDAAVAIGRRPSGLTDRPVLLAALVMGVGLGAGYIVATTVFFRPPPPPPALQGVPELRGNLLGMAAATLADSGLAVSRVDSVHHPGVPAGIVIGQSPLPGRTALPQASVRVTVSMGPDVRPVPDVTRMPGSRAAALLEGSGFVVAVDTVESTAPAGRVIRIEPMPGTPLAIPGEVRVAVSLGPPTVPMPALTGLNQGAAVNLLSALGLVVSEIDYRYSILNVNLVFGQYPGPLAQVEQGSEVRLVIGQRVRAPIGTIFRRRSSRSPEEGGIG